MINFYSSTLVAQVLPIGGSEIFGHWRQRCLLRHRRGANLYRRFPEGLAVCLSAPGRLDMHLMNLY